MDDRNDWRQEIRKSNVCLTTEWHQGRLVTMFRGVPVRITGEAEIVEARKKSDAEGQE
jgi:hypothetical protein